ncbi:MAG: hypothetical protein VX675_05775 [Planctomycetota bacterium]|nr:hypothetical protein [Planctomycetota bacterium]
MHNKLIHWLNLTAYLPVILLQVLNLMPFSAGPATVSTASSCACGCIVSAEESCCCGCPADVKETDREESEDFSSPKTPNSQSSLCLLVPAGCSPAGNEWSLPAPLPDHLQNDSLLCVPASHPAASRPACMLPSPGIPPGNPEKVPI